MALGLTTLADHAALNVDTIIDARAPAAYGNPLHPTFGPAVKAQDHRPQEQFPNRETG